MKVIILTTLILLTISISGCSDSPDNKVQLTPINFSSGDECHVCGMIITRMPGPKGQAYDKRATKVKKFCSTFDLLTWYFQPENKPNIKEMFVHNMKDSDWEKPNDQQLISAKKAFFVLGSSKKAPMGKTIASFSSRQDAQEFTHLWKGNILSFHDLSLELITK